MTREEVINELEYAKAMCEFDPMTGEVGCRNEDDRRQSEAFGIAIETLKNENALIDRVLEIVDDADRKANDKTYIILDDGIFYSQVKYIKEKILELL